MAFNKEFDFFRFKKKFCNKATYTSLSDYFEDKYPHVPRAHIEFFMDYISVVLVEEFRDTNIRYQLNNYCRIHNILAKNLTEEERTRLAWRNGARFLHECREPTEKFIQELLKEDSYKNFETSMLSTYLDDYIALIRELLEDRSLIILSYMYNYLSTTVKEALPRPIEFLTNNTLKQPILPTAISLKNLPNPFFNQTSEPSRMLEEKEENINKKRLPEDDFTGLEQQPLKKLSLEM